MDASSRSEAVAVGVGLGGGGSIVVSYQITNSTLTKARRSQYTDITD